MKISSTRNIIVEIPCAMNRESLRCNGERYNLGVLPRGKKIIYIYIYRQRSARGIFFIGIYARNN